MTSPPPKPRRLLSLDALRAILDGLAIDLQRKSIPRTKGEYVEITKKARERIKSLASIGTHLSKKIHAICSSIIALSRKCIYRLNSTDSNKHLVEEAAKRAVDSARQMVDHLKRIASTKLCIEDLVSGILLGSNLIRYTLHCVPREQHQELLIKCLQWLKAIRPEFMLSRLPGEHPEEELREELFRIMRTTSASDASLSEIAQIYAEIAEVFDALNDEGSKAACAKAAIIFSMRYERKDRKDASRRDLSQRIMQRFDIIDLTNG